MFWIVIDGWGGGLERIWEGGGFKAPVIDSWRFLFDVWDE